jgi:hypothetical protein
MTQLCYGNDDTVTMPASAISIGNSTTDKIGLYGVTAVSQRAGAAQATSAVGTASSADVTTDLKAAVIEIMNCLAAVGLWKGGA